MADWQQSWVALHHQTLASLAAALRRLGRPNAALPLDVAAAQVRADFAQRLLADGELAGFAHFHSDGRVDHLLHPRTETQASTTGCCP